MMVMLAAILVVVVMVMLTFYRRIVFQCAVYIRLCLFVRISAHTAAQRNALLRQCRLCATADAADLVGALVAAMAPPDRDIFLRKYYLLQSGKEIAAALDMSVESINTRLSRGRDRLRRQLTEKGVYTHA